MPRKDRVPALIHGLRLVSALIVAIVVFSAVHAQSQVFHLIHSFASTLGDGNEPNAGLVADAAGNFYGTTWSGGHSMNCPNGGCGSIFERFSNGGFGLIYSFTGGNDGSNPAADLIVGSNGNLYGTTQFGGPTGSGTVFEFVPSTGIKTVLPSIRRWRERWLHPHWRAGAGTKWRSVWHNDSLRPVWRGGGV